MEWEVARGTGFPLCCLSNLTVPLGQSFLVFPRSLTGHRERGGKFNGVLHPLVCSAHIRATPALGQPLFQVLGRQC